MCIQADGRGVGRRSQQRGRGRDPLSGYHRDCLDAHPSAARIDYDMIHIRFDEIPQCIVQPIIEAIPHDDPIARRPLQPRKRRERHPSRICVALGLGYSRAHCLGLLAGRGESARVVWRIRSGTLSE